MKKYCATVNRLWVYSKVVPQPYQTLVTLSDNSQPPGCTLSGRGQPPSPKLSGSPAPETVREQDYRMNGASDTLTGLLMMGLSLQIRTVQ